MVWPLQLPPPTMRLQLTLASVFLLAAGCVGDVGGGGGGGPVDPGPDAGADPGVAAKTQFTGNVFPILAKCSGGACHDVGATSAALAHWHAPTADATYTSITSQPTIVGTFTSIAPILTKIAPGHQGLTYSPAEVTKISNWLDKESSERAGQTPVTPPVDPKTYLQEWSGCMSLANFQTAKMAQAWGNMAATSNQRCANCHGNGAEGFIATTDEALFFKTVSEQSGYMLKYFSVDTQNMKIVINTGSLKNAAEVIVGHPRFNSTSNPGVTALQLFYDATMARKMAGTCDPPRLVD